MYERLMKDSRGKIHRLTRMDERLMEGSRGKIIKLTTTRNLLPVITCAASLAHNRMLGSVEMMELVGSEELTSIPAEHLASLASSV